MKYSKTIKEITTIWNKEEKETIKEAKKIYEEAFKKEKKYQLNKKGDKK